MYKHIYYDGYKEDYLEFRDKNTAVDFINKAKDYYISLGYTLVKSSPYSFFFAFNNEGKVFSIELHNYYIDDEYLYKSYIESIRN